MKLIFVLTFISALVSIGETTDNESRDLYWKNGLKHRGRHRVQLSKNWKVTVTNLSFQQPMSRFFVSAHSSSSSNLFTIGQPVVEAMALLAENGDPQPLVDYYTTTATRGVLSAGIGTTVSLAPGGTLVFRVRTTDSYPLISFASMFTNSNDGFVGVADHTPEDGQILMLPGLDAGSEVNNELCSSIPGPACPEGSGNTRDGNGEGFVHVHRGFHGVGGTLTEPGYDWRNPMLRVAIEKDTGSGNGPQRNIWG